MFYLGFLTHKSWLPGASLVIIMKVLSTVDHVELFILLFIWESFKMFLKMDKLWTKRLKTSVMRYYLTFNVICEKNIL